MCIRDRLDDPVKNYLKQIGQIPLLSAEQEVDLSKRIHAGAEAAHILQLSLRHISAKCAAGCGLPSPVRRWRTGWASCGASSPS